MNRAWKVGMGLGVASLLVACSTTPRQEPPVSAPPITPSSVGTGILAGKPSPYICAYTPLSQARGGFYKDDGPLALPDALDLVPEPLPRQEPLHRWANNPYSVLGQSFVPLKSPGALTQRGVGSWYGRKFHGQKTSSGEAYDMFQMTAAHPTLPIPSYARVTSLKNGRSVVVRINDRGPFLKGRVIDLSFLAACRLGYAMEGSAEVEVVSLSGEERLAAPVVVAAPVVTALETLAESALPEVVVPAAVRSDPVLTGTEVFLQLGAFGSRVNAENFHAHLARELDDTQVARLVIQQAGALYRVRLGPFPDRTAALSEAEKLTGRKNLPAIISR